MKHIAARAARPSASLLSTPAAAQPMPATARPADAPSCRADPRCARTCPIPAPWAGYRCQRYAARRLPGDQTIPVAPGTPSSPCCIRMAARQPRPARPAAPVRRHSTSPPTARRSPGSATRSTVNAFHVELPAGAQEVTAKFVHTSPLSREGRITMTQEMLNLQWEKMSLYPAGLLYARRSRCKPTVTFPHGWTVFTALDGRRAPATP